MQAAQTGAFLAAVRVSWQLLHVLLAGAGMTYSVALVLCMVGLPGQPQQWQHALSHPVAVYVTLLQCVGQLNATS